MSDKEFTIPENIFAENNVNVDFQLPQLNPIPTTKYNGGNICQVSILLPNGSSLDTACYCTDFGQICITNDCILRYLQAVLTNEEDNI